MKKLQFKVLKSYNALFASLISLLGFASSCDWIGMKAMYGTPSGDFIVKGKVESKSNQPVAGIKVEMRREFDTQTGKISVLMDSVASTPSTGIYKVKTNDSPEEQTFKVKFIDVDGATNGEYETLDTTVVFQNPKFTGGNDHWYHGKTEKELNVKLKAKK
jgi:putative lipoprotein (rSAM/lipoprotein system)